jgi:hypothetical protein
MSSQRIKKQFLNTSAFEGDNTSDEYSSMKFLIDQKTLKPCGKSVML